MEIEMQSPLDTEAERSDALRPPIDPSAATLLETLGAEESLSCLSEAQVKELGGEIVTALLRYRVGDLAVHTSKPSSFKFWSFLGAGVVSIGAGSLTLGLGEKPGTLRTIVGSLGIGVGAVSLAGAVVTFPTERETVSYTLTYKTTPAAGGVTQSVTVILPLGLSDVEFVRTSVQQLVRQVRVSESSRQTNPVQEAFNKEQEERVVAERQNLSEESDTPLEPEDLVPPPAPTPDPVQAPKPDPAPSKAESSQSSSSNAPVSKSQSDIDEKYGQVIKQPKVQHGVGEHDALF